MKYKDHRTHGRVLNKSIEDLKPRLDQKRVTGLVLARKKSVLEKHKGPRCNTVRIIGIFTGTDITMWMVVVEAVSFIWPCLR